MRHYGRTQFRYALTYIAITFFVLVFLNFYCSTVCKRLFQQSKEETMLDKTQLVANEIGKLEQLDHTSVATAMSQMGELPLTCLIVTDQSGRVLYCSDGTFAAGALTPYDQVMKAMDGFDVFNWDYKDGVMVSQAAIPVISNGVTVGCVYTMEQDAQQGSVIQSLQSTILTITVTLELAVVLFSLGFAYAFSKRLDKIMASMRILQDGDYTHKVTVGGRDELTVLAREFNDLTGKLEISENKRRQFVSDASHELKTPLATIKLLSDSILQNDMDLDTIREFVEDIGNEAERLNRMSEKLLSLTRSEVRAEEDACEIVLMAPTIQRVARMLSSHAQASQVDIVLDLENDVPILIREDDLYQIAFNLAENGIKYNTKGGTLTLRLSRTEDSGILVVSDTGTGIPADCLSHIFERFYRVDKARSRASGGSGLGLALVRSMVERNQGTIHVESTYGQGTTFTVEFPAFEIEEGEEV